MGDETTNVVNDTVQLALDQANPNYLADVLRQVKLGHFFSVVKAVATGLTSATAQNITTAAFKAASTITGITLATGEELPPIGIVRTLRTGDGPYIVTDSGGTAVTATGTYPGTAKLSDDGTTLTFLAALTALTIEYQPASLISTQAIWSQF